MGILCYKQFLLPTMTTMNYHRSTHSTFVTSALLLMLSACCVHAKCRAENSDCNKSFTPSRNKFKCPGCNLAVPGEYIICTKTDGSILMKKIHRLWISYYANGSVNETLPEVYEPGFLTEYT